MYTLLTNTDDFHSFNQVKASTDRRLLKKIDDLNLIFLDFDVLGLA